MNRRTILSVAIIILAFAAIGGATMAWFTDSVELENTFTAGTLDIDGSDKWVNLAEGAVWTNVNPGDCREKEFTINNKGSKHSLLRFKFTGEWGQYNEEGTWVRMEEQAGNLVTVSAPEGWTLHEGWWYYTDKLVPTNGLVKFALKVCVDGKGTGNKYQGMSYKLDFTFEAIQASNNASGDAWDVNSVYNSNSDGSMAAADWDRFDFEN